MFPSPATLSYLVCAVRSLLSTSSMISFISKMLKPRFIALSAFLNSILFNDPEPSVSNCWKISSTDFPDCRTRTLSLARIDSPNDCSRGAFVVSFASPLLPMLSSCLSVLVEIFYLPTKLPSLKNSMKFFCLNDSNTELSFIW